MYHLYKHPLLPQNYIAEELLLGVILIYPNIFSNIVPFIKKEYFFLESHQIIYINLLNIHKYKKLNIIELLYKLESNKVLYTVGGLSKITNMMKQSQIFIFSSHINNYIEELIELVNSSYIKRLVIQYGHNIMKLGYTSQSSKNNLYNKALSYLNFTKVEINENEENMINFKDLISEKLLQIKYHKTDSLIPKKQKLIKSGFIDLDKITSGLPNGDLIIVAGRPSMGKTSFAINIAYNNFSKERLSICIFSLETPSKQILNKFISIGSQIPINNHNYISRLNPKQWRSITNICYRLLDNNIYINDNVNMEINYIDYVAKNLKKKDHNIQLIIIDYLQLIQLNKNNNKTYNRNQELSYITRKLKLLAQFLKLPVIVLSQLNRNIETRSERKPLLSDLKEGGCIDYTDNIKLSSLLNNDINLVNLKIIHQSLIKTETISNNKTTKKYTHKKLKKEIYISPKYIFKCEVGKKILSLTNNHKYLSQDSWIRTYKILNCTKINCIEKNYKDQLKLNKKISINYINQVKFSIYSKSYDINTENHFNFVSKQTILHNSIEQDADIVMILYYSSEENVELKDKRILDIIICKNRNGPTGSCKIAFIPTTTVFQSASKKQI
uniref:DNA 5'-3' helicase n=1 Tax=Bostrychia tenella TaxID=324755 RepID=A0A1Z1M5Q5_9FLOR|nr:Replication helicase subunit [Bostrychia tenella]ARW61326.1 Replication helicase subunit [Bostrychia tenella]